MAAPIGTRPFTTEASKDAEEKHTSIINDILQEEFPAIEIRKAVSIDSLVEGKIEYSHKKDRSSQEWLADGGWLYYNDKLVGVLECKYQKTRQNACERLFRYLAVNLFRRQPYRVFVSCYGPGFESKMGGGSTGPVLDMARNAGIKALENPSEAKFIEELRSWIKLIL